MKIQLPLDINNQDKDHNIKLYNWTHTKHKKDQLPILAIITKADQL